MIPALAVLGWLLASLVVGLVVSLFADWSPTCDIEVQPVPEPLSREDSWELDLPWYDPQENRLVYRPEGWSVDGPDLDLHADLHSRRADAELAASPQRLHLTLTGVDVLYIAGTWLHRGDQELPPRQGDVHLPSGRVLSGAEVADFVRWLRWREGQD